MFGLPRSRSGLTPMRVYVPFGNPSLPYAPGRARRNARVAGWIARDLALPWLWAQAWAGDNFVWRGNAMSVAEEGTGAATGR